MLVQACVIAFDIGLTTFDYKNMFTLKCTLHPFVYALKLRLEFIVLNQLLSLVRKGLTQPMGLLTDSDGSSSEKGNSNGDLMPHATLADAERLKAASTFITKSPIAAAAKVLPSASYSSSSSSSSTAGIRKESTTTIKYSSPRHSHARTDSKLTSSFEGQSDDEQDLKDVIGRPDDDDEIQIITKTVTALSDLERQYLGRCSAGSERGA